MPTPTTSLPHWSRCARTGRPTGGWHWRPRTSWAGLSWRALVRRRAGGAIRAVRDQSGPLVRRRRHGRVIGTGFASLPRQIETKHMINEVGSMVGFWDFLKMSKANCSTERRRSGRCLNMWTGSKVRAIVETGCTGRQKLDRRRMQHNLFDQYVTARDDGSALKTVDLSRRRSLQRPRLGPSRCGAWRAFHFCTIS